MRVSWEVESDLKWEDYAQWVASSLGDYTLVVDQRDTLRLRRQLEGDVYTLVLSPTPGAGSLIVEISFEASPF